MNDSSLTLPELEDSGTQSLKSITGYESITCGTFTYTMTSSQAWIVQNSLEDRLFSIEVDTDPSLQGDHTLSVEVSSDEYHSDISVYTISVPITVISLCHSSVLKTANLSAKTIELMTSAIPTILTLLSEDSGTQSLQ